MKELANVAEYHTAIKNNARVVIDFHATWCGPCQAVEPKFDEMSRKYTKIAFFKVDVDDASDIAEECGISAMPTFIFYVNGAAQGDPILGANTAAIEDRLKQMEA